MLSGILVLVLIQHGICKTTFDGVFPGAPIQITTTEELPVGSTIGVLKASTDQNSSDIRYELEDQEFFEVDAISGALKNKKIIDFEKTKVLYLSAFAYTDPSQKAEAQLLVQVKNINDNIPLFTQPSYEVHVKEDLNIGGFVGKVTSIDADETDIVSYKLNTHNNLFQINNDGVITSRAILDYEKKEVHRLNILSSDGELSSSVILSVYVDDNDDQGAVFEKDVYTGHIEEGNYQQPVKVVTVHAYDLDFGLNDSVSYQLLQENSLVVLLNNETGEVFLHGNIDREEKQTIEIQILAKSTHHVAAKTLVKIEVRDTNDNRPQFVDTEIEGQTSENSIVGTPVLRLTAVDRDEGNNSVLAFEILNMDVPFLITDEGEIQVKSSLDRETTDLYNLTIRVYEKFSVEQYSNTTYVLLEIIDANDNTPSFSNDNFTIEVSENRPVSNQSLFAFTAVDQDIGENGRVEFSLDTPNTPFTLNKSSGVLTLTGELDYETSPAYNLQVSVHDSPLNEGKQRRTSTVLRVNVLNTNDNPPVFQQSIYTSSILEVVHNRTTVLNVLAIDADNDDIEYTITDGDHGKFSIDQTSAEIFTVDYLDRETQDVYNLTVRASDGVYSTHCHVLIKILDGNDNWPIFNETDDQYFFSVLETVNVSFVGKVQATDIDLEMAGHVTYSLPGNTMFAIGKESGIIRNIVPLDRETTNLHTFTVVARDSANDYRSSFAQVTVKVLDTNDNAPFFTSLTSSELLINAHTPNRTLLTVFNAQDADDTANSISVYTAKNLPDFLELNNQTGELHLTSIPETFFAAKFQVTATNVQPPFHNATIEIEAKITSLENYDAPEFSKGAYELSVQENLPIGTVVYDFNATYKGQPESPSFVYKLVAMDTHQYFHLEEDGRLSTLKMLDREEINDYKLTISVSLRDSSASNFASVVIHVLDVNDNRPYFVSGNVTKYIRETSDIGTVVTQVQAADGDEKPVFFFKIIDSSEFFSIEENTGVIRVHSNLKTISLTEIPLIISVNDGFGNWQGSKVKVVVTLLTNETIGEVVTLHQGNYVSENKQDLVYLLGNLTDSEVFIDRISSESPTGYLVQFYSVKNGVLQNKDAFKSAFTTVESDVMREWIEKWKLYLISNPTAPGATSAIDHEERYLLIGIIIALAFLLICALILALFVRIKANKRQQRLLTPTYLRGSPTKERYNKDLYNSIRLDEAGPFYAHDTLSIVPGTSRTELPTPDGTLTASSYTKMETLRSHQPHQRLAIPEYPPTTAEDEGNLANGRPATDFVYTGENRDVAGNGDANLPPADDVNQMSSYIKNLENFDFYPDKTDNRADDGGEAVEGPEVDGRGMVYVSPMSKSPTDSRSEADDTIKTFCEANNADENNDVNNNNNEQETLGASNIAFEEEDARSTVVVRGQMSTTL